MLGFGLVFGTELCSIQAHGHLAKLDGMPFLTQREQDLLQRYQQLYLDLVEGWRLLETDAQRRFLDVAAGRLPPVPEHDRLWVRWQRMIRDRTVRALKPPNGHGPPRRSSPRLIRPLAHRPVMAIFIRRFRNSTRYICAISMRLPLSTRAISMMLNWLPMQQPSNASSD
jgi:hypothetical protein